jgi:hypothetical protein
MDNEQQFEVKEVKRDKLGRILPGYSGNYNGRPSHSISLTTEIKKKLDEVNPESHKTYLEELLNKILEKAIKDGDPATIKQVWNYLDGMPKQSIEVNDNQNVFIAVVNEIKQLADDIRNEDDRPEAIPAPIDVETEEIH